MQNNTEKFTGKADSYEKYRPSYPEEFIDYLYGGAGFSEESIIADIGAGTGKLTELLLQKNSFVYAVEPNSDMRGVLKEKFSRLTNFTAVSAPAESTTLPAHSVDFITVAQAFHWFDAEQFKAECRRILKPGGKVALLWNGREESSGIVKAYDEVCRKFCPEFKGAKDGRRGRNASDYDSFFKNGTREFKDFVNIIPLSLDKFIGAVTSASYAPNEDDEVFPALKAALTEVFGKFSSDGILKMPFFTMSYLGEV